MNRVPFALPPVQTMHAAKLHPDGLSQLTAKRAVDDGGQQRVDLGGGFQVSTGKSPRTAMLRHFGSGHRLGICAMQRARHRLASQLQWLLPDRYNAAVGDRSLLGDGMRFVVPARGLELWYNELATGISFGEHGRVIQGRGDLVNSLSIGRA